MKNDTIFNQCCLYFIEDISDWLFLEELREKVAYGISEKEALAAAMASWIPWEEHADKLCVRIREWADE